MKNLINSLLIIFSMNHESIQKEKKTIRSQIHLLKLRLSDEEKFKEANAVFEKIEILPEFKAANTILMYWSTKYELPTHDIIKEWITQKFIILPSIVGKKMVLKRLISVDNLVQKTLGIWEPYLTDIYTGKIDLAIVPGVAFDVNKNRLGRGKGYYDLFFKKKSRFKIGIGFDFQLLKSIPIQRFDKKMDKIITMSNTIE